MVANVMLKLGLAVQPCWRRCISHSSLGRCTKPNENVEVLLRPVLMLFQETETDHFDCCVLTFISAIVLTFISAIVLTFISAVVLTTSGSAKTEFRSSLGQYCSIENKLVEWLN